MDGGDPVIDSTRADDAAGRDSRPADYRDRREVRVRRAHPPAVMHGYRETAGNGSGKCHRSRSGGRHGCADRGREIDPPMASIGTLRGEVSDHRARDRRTERARQGDDQGKKNRRQA